MHRFSEMSMARSRALCSWHLLPGSAQGGRGSLYLALAGSVKRRLGAYEAVKLRRKLRFVWGSVGLSL